MGGTKEEKRGQFQRLEGEIAEESKRLAIAIGGAAIYSAGVISAWRFHMGNL